MNKSEMIHHITYKHKIEHRYGPAWYLPSDVDLPVSRIWINQNEHMAVGQNLGTLVNLQKSFELRLP